MPGLHVDCSPLAESHCAPARLDRELDAVEALHRVSRKRIERADRAVELRASPHAQAAARLNALTGELAGASGGERVNDHVACAGTHLFHELRERADGRRELDAEPV